MRRLEYLAAFRRDLKKIVKSGRYRLADIDEVVENLRRDQPLATRQRDHALTGNWKDHRECHIKPDWLLIYRLEPGVLVLVRTGSHA
jgi:mRNA interferase YafQ